MWYSKQTPVKELMTTEVKEFIPSTQQQDYFDWLANGSGSVILEAFAGCGKTSTLIEGLPYMQGSIFFGAYNKKIVEELQACIGDIPYVKVSTMHGAGFGFLKRIAPDSKLENSKMRDLYRSISGFDKQLKSLENTIVTLVGYAKQAAVGITCPIDDTEAWHELIDQFALDTNNEPEVVIFNAIKLLKLSISKCEEIIDFEDMIYYPLYKNAVVGYYDWVLVDECFIGDTPILVGLNGESMTIKEMHDTKYTGSVVTWDESTESTILSKIVGSKKTPVGKPLFQIKTRQIGFKKNGVRLAAHTEQVKYGERIVICTGDHKIWTTVGWVSASELTVGTTVKHETVAPIDHSFNQRYKHTPKGRLALTKKASVTRFGTPFKPTGLKRGGNGKGATRHEALLLERLGGLWVSGQNIPTKELRSSGYPTHYKFDLANFKTKVCIEVDGHSHKKSDRKEQDIKKTAWLESKGWSVVRITNKEVLSLTNDLLMERVGNCPVDAEVTSVAPWLNTKHDYVYDISVADTHCYYAHGLLVHNCQDLNETRRMLSLAMLKKGGRLVGCGDKFQAIYAFAGADHNSMDLLQSVTNASSLPLSVSYRCPKKVIKLAQKYVPDIEAHEDAPEGIVRSLEGIDDMMGEVKKGDVILCRFNAPIVEIAYDFILHGIPAKIEGKDIGGGLKTLANKWEATDWKSYEDKLAYYVKKQIAAYEEADKLHMVEAWKDKYNCINTIIHRVKAKKRVGSPADLICAEVDSIFGEVAAMNSSNCVILSSIHKAKGCEFSKVYVLTHMPRLRKMQDWEKKAERNLQYVAITRAKHELVFVPLPLPTSVDAE